MKILHVCEYTIGGISTYLSQVIKYQQQDHEVYMVLSKTNSQKSFDIPNDHIFYYEYSRNIRYFLNTIREIRQSIDMIEPDIIHIHSTFAGFFTRLPLFLTKTKAKIIYCPHGWSFLMEVSSWKKRLYLLIERVLSYKTDVIINISKHEYQESIYSGIPTSKSTMIYNGVAPSANFKKVNFQVDEKKINLLFIGRFDKQKGIDILLELFKNHHFDQVHLYTIGNAVLNNENPEINIQNVTNIGWVDHTDIDSYICLFDAVIIPSRWEGFGLVAIEAMRNKKAVIASNRGALPELIKHEFNGYVFNLDSIEDLVQIMNQLDKGQLKSMGENGYRLFKEKFTSELMNKKLIKEYMKALQ